MSDGRAPVTESSIMPPVVPTRIALFSDIHGDLRALEDALVAAGRLGCTRFLCAGDLVDYGRDANGTIALLRDRAIPTVLGNHDRWATSGRRADVSAASQSWLRSLPETWSETVEGCRVVVTHARWGSDMAGIDPKAETEIDVRRMLAEAAADVLIVGHTHVAFELWCGHSQKIVNPAALLRDVVYEDHADLATGTFGVLELPSGEFTVHRADSGEQVDIVRRCLTEPDGPPTEAPTKPPPGWASPR